MKENIAIEQSVNGNLIFCKKNKESEYSEKIEVEINDGLLNFEIEQSGYNEHGFGTDYSSFSLNKEQSLALAKEIMSKFVE